MPNFTHSYALVIGIDTYQNGLTPLNNAVNDGRAIADLLESQHDYEVWRLFDKAASREAIAHYLKHKLPQTVKANDRLLFCFSGHGIQLNSQEGPEGYLIPQSAQIGKSDTYLSMNEVYKDLSALPCRHLFGILDCCFAGSFRWASQQRKASVIDSATLYRETFERFIQDPAWQVITSAAYDQEAHDAFDLRNDRGQATSRPQHSPFAAALLEALEGKADTSPPAKEPGGKPGDGVITATELYLYVRDAIEPATERRSMRQTPGLYSLGKHDKGEYIFLTPDHPLNLPFAPPLDRSTNPYKGLASFEETDCDRYFGRKEITAKLYQFFLDQQLTIVLGASGSGKSSLVKAGLLPLVRNLKQGKTPWTVLSPFRPGRSPFRALNQVVAELSLPKARSVLAKPYRNQVLLLEASLESWFQENSAPLVMVIDQFEELITRCTAQERAEFLRFLTTALERYPQKMRLLLTLRSDFESQFQDSSLSHFWQQSRFQVPLLTRQNLREVIEGPAALKVLFFDPSELINRLIDEVINMPGGLPLLSFALSELYLSYLKRQEIARKQGKVIDRVITQTDYEALGGVTKALVQRAEAEYKQLVQQDTAYAQTTQQVMLRMVALGAGELARRAFTASEQQFPEPEQHRVQTVINRFLAARLLVAGKATDGESFVEPAHDALVQGWPRLSQWLKQENTQETVLLIRSLTTAANQWVHREQDKQAQGLLWKDNPRLPQALQIMCGSSYRESRRNFIKWLWQGSRKALRVSKQGFWDSLNRSAWLNESEEKFVMESLNYKYRNRLVGYGITTLVITALLTFSGLAEFQRRQAEYRADIAQLREQAARTINLLPTIRATEGLALAVATLQQSSQIPVANRDNAYESLTKSVQSSLLSAVQTARGFNVMQHGLWINAVAFSNDNQVIISGSDDGTVRLWDLNGEPIGNPLKHDEWVVAIDVHPNKAVFVSASDSGSIQLWDFSGNPVSDRIEAHEKRINSVFFSPTGNIMASGSDDGTIKLWNLEGKQIGETLNAHTRGVNSISFSPTDNSMASGSDDGTIKLWNLEGEQIGETFNAHTKGVNSVAFSPDGKMLASGGADGHLKLWNKEGSLIDNYQINQLSIDSVAFSPDGKTIVSGGGDSTLRLLELQSSSIQSFPGHEWAVLSTAFSSDGQMLVSGGLDGTIRLWDLHRHSLGTTFQTHEQGVHSAAFSPDGHMVGSGGKDGSIHLWDLHGNPISEPFIGHQSWVRSLAFSPNSKMIASGGSDGAIRLWDLDGNSIGTPFESNSDEVFSVAFSPDGEHIVSGSESKNSQTLQMWDLEGKAFDGAFEEQQVGVLSVAFSPNGQMIASGDRNSLVKLWNAEGDLISTFAKGHRFGVNSVAFSPYGQMLVSGGGDGSLRLWNLQGDMLVEPFQGHRFGVTSVDFSHDGTTIVSGSMDGTVRFWDLQGNPIGSPIQSYSTAIRSVSFHPDDKQIMTSSSQDGNIMMWDSSWHGWIKIACNRLQQHPIWSQRENYFEQEVATAVAESCQPSFEDK